MNASKLFLLLSFTLLMTLGSFGQKIHDKDYKHDVTLNNYRETVIHHKYSPLAAGLCNYIFPAAGYFYVGEPLRGVCVLGGELVASSISICGLVMSMEIDVETGQSDDGARMMMYGGMIAAGLIQIWSIYDVVKIAKVKNIANQQTNISVEVRPDFHFTSQMDNKSPVVGLSLSLNF